MKCLDCNGSLNPDNKTSTLTVNARIIGTVDDRKTQPGDHYTCPHCAEIGCFNEDMDLVPLDEEQLTNLFIRAPQAAEKLVQIKENILKKKRKK